VRDSRVRLATALDRVGVRGRHRLAGATVLAGSPGLAQCRRKRLLLAAPVFALLAAIALLVYRCR
jgi:hypothetical protein